MAERRLDAIACGGLAVVRLGAVDDAAVLDREDGVRVQIGAACYEDVRGQRDMPRCVRDEVNVRGTVRVPPVALRE